jgi:hypothetical protein
VTVSGEETPELRSGGAAVMALDRLIGGALSTY